MNGNGDLSEKIYLAGPFFNAEQLEVQQRVEKICIEYGWQIFSPRLELMLKKDSPIEEQRRCFFMNNRGLKKCKLIFANVEGLDTGTLWEMGAAYAYNRPVVIYSPNPARKLNVMLAQGAVGYVAGWDAIEHFLRPTLQHTFDWSIPKVWDKEVF
jgi:nucleoside 2-deoxyribosyltransferase